MGHPVNANLQTQYAPEMFRLIVWKCLKHDNMTTNVTWDSVNKPYSPIESARKWQKGQRKSRTLGKPVSFYNTRNICTIVFWCVSSTRPANLICICFLDEKKRNIEQLSKLLKACPDFQENLWGQGSSQSWYSWYGVYPTCLASWLLWLRRFLQSNTSSSVWSLDANQSGNLRMIFLDHVINANGNK